MRQIKSKEDLPNQLKTAVKKPVEIQCFQMKEAFEVHTMEGVMKGKENDWLIIGVEGEVYACDNEIFHKTYELLP